MNKFKIISKKFNFAVLLVSAILLISSSSCKKTANLNDEVESTSSGAKVVSGVSGAETYAALIKANTTLIKTVTSNVTTVPYAGVEYTRLTYTNQSDQPMALYFYTVDLNQDGVSLEVANPNNGTDLNAKQTVRSQVSYKNAAHTSDNLEVIGAVNGDYWRVSTTEVDPTPVGQPYGMVVKKGVVLKPITTDNIYYYFSIQQSLSAYFGTKGDAYIPTVREGLGGRYLLVQNGVEKPTALGYNTNVEPRTAVGMINPKKVVFLVVDGRSSTYSQGYTMANLAKIFKAIGCTEAVNMDGGGSSTFVLKEGSGYTIKNRPSDGERSVASAWTILGRKAAIPPGTFDNFNTGVGRFYSQPTATSTTVGVSTTSTAQWYDGVDLQVAMNDDASVTTPWKVRLLSGGGAAANNVLLPKTGKVWFYAITSSAQPGATVKLFLDDSDGTEQTPSLPVVSGAWHKYEWDLSTIAVTRAFSTLATDHKLTAANVTLDAIVMEQSNTATQWRFYIDNVGKN